MTQLLQTLHALDQEWRGLAPAAAKILLIIALAWALQRVAARVIRSFHAYMAQRTSGMVDPGRVQTLERVFRYIANVVIALVAGTLILGQLGISIAPILATAGVAGVAIGFGAQSLIKDYFTGFFLLLEDQIRQGDVIQIGDKAGIVEEVTLRYVRLRDLDGYVHFLPNGEIKSVTNRTRDFAYAVVEVGVSCTENADTVLEIMRTAGNSIRTDPAYARYVQGECEVIGVERLDGSALVLRARLKVAPLEQQPVRREFLKRIKTAFDAQGVQMPAPGIAVQPGDAGASRTGRPREGAGR
jgi:small-conductance mechanosensitive channel